MNFLKFKFALAKTRQPARFNKYLTLNDSTSPEDVGLLLNDSMYRLATPNLTRQDDILILASNSTSKDSLSLKIKWRPNENSRLVTQHTELKIVSDKILYKYEKIETFSPSMSKAHPNFIMQYGSNYSDLKLIISLPYRRARILFYGHMKKYSNDNNETCEDVFVKLNLVISQCSDFFDFNYDINENCFKEFYEKNQVKLDYVTSLNKLYFHDRHEHLIRIRGDCLIIDNDVRTKKILFLWGFHSRHFHDENSNIQTKRLYAFLDNGQAFHLGLNSKKESDFENSIGFGYTCLEMRSNLTAIVKPYKIDWNQINQDTKEFQLELFDESKSFNCSCKLREFSSNFQFFDAKMGTRNGWAWLSLNSNEPDTKLEAEAFKRNHNEYLESIQTNAILNPRRSIELFEKAKTSKHPLIIGLDEDICSCSEFVGSKGQSLAQLWTYSKQGNNDINYFVPYAFILTRFSYDLIVSNNPNIIDAIKKLETKISDGNLDELKICCDNLQNIFKSTQLPDVIKEEIKSVLSTKYNCTDDNSDTLFAVRSSSWGEDEEDMSAAGQLTTLLCIKGLDAISRSIMECFASKFSYENIEYKRQHGLPITMPMAVIIQEMIQCNKAGVMFTCDPTNGNSSYITITANYGLGESVVSGQSDPDSIQVNVKHQQSEDNEKSKTEVIFDIRKIDIGLKSSIVDSERGTIETKSTNYDSSRCCLNDDEILKLAKCGHKLEKYFQSKRDIEWGYIGDQLYLFQSRPVTGLDTYTDEELLHEYDQPARAEVDFFSRANIGEVLPYAIKPFTLTSSILSWKCLSSHLISRLADLDTSKISPESSTEVIYDSYHSFFNLRRSSFLAVASKNQEKSIMMKALEIGFFGHEVGDQPEIIEASEGISPQPNIFEGTRFKIISWPLKTFPIYTITRERKIVASLKTKLNEIMSSKPANELDRLQKLVHLLGVSPFYGLQAWMNHIIMIGFGSASNMTLLAIFSKYISDPIKLFSSLNKVIGNGKNVISAEIPKQISKLSDLLITLLDKNDIEKFTEMTSKDCIEFINDKRSKFVELDHAFDDFIKCFGHRCYNEFELAESSWREDPSFIIDSIRKQCKTKLSNNTEIFKQSKITDLNQLIDSLNLNGLTSGDKKLLMKKLIPNAQLMVSCREQTKDILIYHSDIQREITRNIAIELRKLYRLPDVDLLYYVFYDELKPLINDYQPSIVLQAIKRRNFFRKTFSIPWKYDEIIKGANVIPNHLKEDKQLYLSPLSKLTGTPASSGKIKGYVCLVKDYLDIDKVKPGSILLTYSTDIGFSPIFPLISGIITEVGGLISHGAVVAREYGLPSVLGIPNVTKILQDGEQILLDADNGTIIRLSKATDESIGDSEANNLVENGHCA